MKDYCYVILNNSGYSWMARNGHVEAVSESNPAVLPHLLAQGWAPVRETPMGGGTGDVSHSLILLEKAAAAKKVGRPAKK
jgi:hypothetical protein